MKKLIMVAIAATALFSACNKQGAVKTSLKSDVDTLSYTVGLAMGQSDDQIKGILREIDADTTLVASFDKGFSDAFGISLDERTRAYYIGYLIGLQTNIGQLNQIENIAFPGNKDSHLSKEIVLAGMKAARSGKSDLTVTIDAMGQKQEQTIEAGQTAQMYLQQYMFDMYRKCNEKFMADVAKESGVKSLGSGVYYKELKKGTGAIPTAEQTVAVSYVGSFIDGKEFDNSQGEAVEFPVNAVVPGWTTALTQMPVGSEWEVYIPWNMGYGEQGNYNIMPYSALVFKMKLEAIK